MNEKRTSPAHVHVEVEAEWQVLASVTKWYLVTFARLRFRHIICPGHPTYSSDQYCCFCWHTRCEIVAKMVGSK